MFTFEVRKHVGTETYRADRVEVDRDGNLRFYEGTNLVGLINYAYWTSFRKVK